MIDRLFLAAGLQHSHTNYNYKRQNLKNENIRRKFLNRMSRFIGIFRIKVDERVAFLPTILPPTSHWKIYVMQGEGNKKERRTTDERVERTCWGWIFVCKLVPYPYTKQSKVHWPSDVQASSFIKQDRNWAGLRLFSSLVCVLLTVVQPFYSAFSLCAVINLFLLCLKIVLCLVSCAIKINLVFSCETFTVHSWLCLWSFNCSYFPVLILFTSQLAWADYRFFNWISSPKKKVRILFVFFRTIVLKNHCLIQKGNWHNDKQIDDVTCFDRCITRNHRDDFA